MYRKHLLTRSLVGLLAIILIASTAVPARDPKSNLNEALRYTMEMMAFVRDKSDYNSAIGRGQRAQEFVYSAIQEAKRETDKEKAALIYMSQAYKALDDAIKDLKADQGASAMRSANDAAKSIDDALREL